MKLIGDVLNDLAIISESIDRGGVFLMERERTVGKIEIVLFQGNIEYKFNCDTLIRTFLEVIKRVEDFDALIRILRTLSLTLENLISHKFVIRR